LPFLAKAHISLIELLPRGTTPIIFVFLSVPDTFQVKSSLYFASLAPGLSLVSIASLSKKYPSAIASRVSDSHLEKSFQSIDYL
jgi:hypothetical protein